MMPAELDGFEINHNSSPPQTVPPTLSHPKSLPVVEGEAYSKLPIDRDREGWRNIQRVVLC
jgi:hypothetical protein